jgi:hypothetical protein
MIKERAARRGLKIEVDEFYQRSMLTTSCGLGPATVEVADRALDLLVQVGAILKNRTS